MDRCVKTLMKIGLSLIIVGIRLCESQIIVSMSKIMDILKAKLLICIVNNYTVWWLQTASYIKIICLHTFIIILHMKIWEMRFALITWTDVLSLGASKDVLWSGDEICQAWIWNWFLCLKKCFQSSKRYFLSFQIKNMNLW